MESSCVINDGHELTCMLVEHNVFMYVVALVFSIDSGRIMLKKSIRTMESLLAHDIKHQENMAKLPQPNHSKRLMGAVLVGQSSSRNSSIHLRQSPLKRDDVSTHTRGSKYYNEDKELSTIPVDSEALRELKRRVLVCLDNNATAEQVARSLVNDCPEWSSKLKNVSDVIAHYNNNAAGNNSRRMSEASSLPITSSSNSPRRRLSTSHTDSSVRSSSLQKQRIIDDLTPLEIVTECFNLLDRLLADISRKDDEISRLQRQLAAAEERGSACEKRLKYLRHYCHVNGIMPTEYPPTPSVKQEVGDPYDDECDQHTLRHPPETLESKANTDVASSRQTNSDKSRSPRKARRSSVELLTLPSIHNTPPVMRSYNTGISQTTEVPMNVMEKVRKRRASALDGEPGGPLKKSKLAVSQKLGADSELDSAEVVSKWREKQTFGSSPINEEDNANILSSCLSTIIQYCYTDYDVMLNRREREAEIRARVKRIDTPGWRIAPVRGRTRAATHAAVTTLSASVVDSSNSDSGAEQVPADLPAEGSGFEEWAALADEPFETRHLRHEQQEKRRERLEMRAYREFQRQARLRETLEGGSGGGPGHGGAMAGSGTKNGGAGASDGVATEGGGPGKPRKGLPDTLWPEATNQGDFRDCRLFYYSKDCMPVVAFGRLLPPRQKCTGFSLLRARLDR